MVQREGGEGERRKRVQLASKNWICVSAEVGSHRSAAVKRWADLPLPEGLWSQAIAEHCSPGPQGRSAEGVGVVWGKGEVRWVEHHIAEDYFHQLVSRELARGRGMRRVWGQRGGRVALTRCAARLLPAEQMTCISFMAAGWGRPWATSSEPPGHR